jgi:hypothetical protein
MGAQEFIVEAEGSNVQAAFKAAHEQATREHGHGGYTGSLAEKDSFVLIDTQHRTREEAIECGEKLLANDDPRCDDKWSRTTTMRLQYAQFFRSNSCGFGVGQSSS